MRFLADENFPFPALSALRNYGYDVYSIAGRAAGSSDKLVAQICDAEARILLTSDKDFGDLVFRQGLSSGSSVVLLRIVPEPDVVADAIHSLIAHRPRSLIVQFLFLLTHIPPRTLIDSYRLSKVVADSGFAIAP